MSYWEMEVEFEVEASNLSRPAQRSDLASVYLHYFRNSPKPTITRVRPAQPPHEQTSDSPQDLHLAPMLHLHLPQPTYAGHPAMFPASTSPLTADERMFVHVWNTTQSRQCHRIGKRHRLFQTRTSQRLGTSLQTASKLEWRTRVFRICTTHNIRRLTM